MKWSRLYAVLNDFWKKITIPFTVQYDCYHCKKRIRGSEDEKQCVLCGRLSCSECLTQCEECGDQICYDCHIMCRNCCEIICSTCSPKCSDCSRPICSNCSARCEKCGQLFCPNCTEPSSAKLAYLCENISEFDVVCNSCYSVHCQDLELAIGEEHEIQTWPSSYKGKVPCREPLKRLSTTLFDNKENALRSLRITTAYLNLKIIYNISYVKHKARSGNKVRLMWQAKGIAANREEQI